MQKSATVAVINDNKKILLLRRGDTAPWMPGKYCLPGGKVDNNESLINCAARELGEETGIYVDNINCLIPYNIFYSSSYNKIVFLICLCNPVVCLNWEHDNYVWVSSKESLWHDLVPGLKATIKSFCARGLMN